MLRKLAKGVLATSAAGIGAVCGYATYDEGFSRSLQFWQRTFPIYMHYRYVQWNPRGLSEAEQDAELEKLHAKYADPVLQIILDLKGFYIKIGQVGSTRNDFVPKQFIKNLSTLQDKVPPEDFSVIRGVVERSYGKKIEEVFSHFEEAPLGAASIGQVHRATLLRDGSHVVVKVQYPKVKELFTWDLKTCKDFCAMAQPESLPLMDEVSKQFMKEFDYTREAKFLAVIGDNMRVAFPNVRVPRPIPDLCTERVLVMEYIPGKKLVDGVSDMFNAIASAKGMTLDELKEDFEKKIDPTKPRVPMSKSYILALTGFLNFKAFLYNFFAFAFNHTIGFITLGKKTLAYSDPKAEVAMLNAMSSLDSKQIIHDLLLVHGHQIFRNGVFNGDPHCGNILLLPDGQGYGLIDYGQVKEITDDQRVLLAKLIVALDEDQIHQTPQTNARVVAIFCEMGFKSEKMDPYVISRTAKIFFDNDGRHVTENLNLQLYMEYLSARDKTIQFPNDYLMAGRVSILFRGLGTILGYHPLSVARIWRPLADEVLKNQNAIVAI